MARTFALWGAPESGKTNFLLSLLFWQEHGEDSQRGRRFCLVPASPKASDWVVPRAVAVANGEPIARTNSFESLQFRLYDLPPEKQSFWQRARPSAHVADLTIWDAPGEVFLGPIRGPFLDDLVSAGGLIVLLNPFQARQPGGKSFYWNFLHDALGSVHRAMLEQKATRPDIAIDLKTRKIQCPVAICLSQVDKAAELGEDAGRDPREWLDELLGRDASLLYDWMANMRVFSFSAWGKRPLVEGRPVGDPQPVNVMHPVTWLVSETERLGL